MKGKMMIVLNNKVLNKVLILSDSMILLFFFCCTFFVDLNLSIFNLGITASKVLLFSIIILGFINNVLVLIVAKKVIVFSLVLFFYLVLIAPYFIG